MAARIGFTVAALGLLLFWGRPFGRVEAVLHLESQLQTKQLAGGPEVFVLSALMVLLGAIWLVMYNSDLLIRGVMFFTGRISGLAAVTRTSMSYPMATKFRTGMAVAMFAIVTFIIVYMSVFKDVLVQNFAQVDAGLGRMADRRRHTRQQLQPDRPDQVPDRRRDARAGNPTLAGEVRGRGLGERRRRGVQLQQVKADGTVSTLQPDSFNALRVVDRGYLSATGYALQPRAAGYSSDRAVWDAVRDHPGYAVINASSLDARTSGPADIVGIKPTDATFQPFQIQVAVPWLAARARAAATTMKLTVVGFMSRHALWGGVYVSTRHSGPERDVRRAGTRLASAPHRHGRSRWPLGGAHPDRLFLHAQAGCRRQQSSPRPRPPAGAGPARAGHRRRPARAAVERHPHAAQPVTGFLALGLIVGIAGLGVISTRAVVERWQQIGMLRALGYRRSLVQRSFLMESSLIAILGLIIGTLVGRLAVVPLLRRRQDVRHGGLPRPGGRDRVDPGRRISRDAGDHVPASPVGVESGAGGGPALRVALRRRAAARSAGSSGAACFVCTGSEK